MERGKNGEIIFNGDEKVLEMVGRDGDSCIMM